MRAVITTLLAAATLLAAGPAFAFRCQGKIVSEGDPQAKVLRYCGEPVSAQQRTIWRSGFPRGREVVVENGNARLGTGQELLVHDRSVVEVVVEEWTYNLGPRKLMRVVRFEDGVVTKVDTLGYGYHD